MNGERILAAILSANNKRLMYKPPKGASVTEATAPRVAMAILIASSTGVDPGEVIIFEV